jgi:hypothetical protein
LKPKDRGSKKQIPSHALPASRLKHPAVACEHLQEPRNAGSRPEAPFFNSLPTLLIRTLFTQAIFLKIYRSFIAEFLNDKM